MILERFHDLCDIFLCLVIFVFHGVQLVGILFEETEEAFLLLFRRIKALELRHHAGEHITYLTEVLCLDIFQGCLGKISHFFLGSGSVLEDHIVIGQINLFHKIIHHFPLIII